MMGKELLKLIDSNNVISFDIFDTLLLRNVYKPTDIFRILSKIAFEKYNIEDFYSIRVVAEKESRTEENNNECRFDEIYKKIGDSIKDKKIVKKLKEEELYLEEKFLVVNPFMKKIYDYCISKKKKVLLISDMYLDEKFIQQVLKKCGYKDYTLYLSNVYRMTKGDMSLFNLVLNKEKIEKNFWLHIGDNKYSDYESPIHFGIKAYHYKGVYSYVNIKEYSIFESIILGIQNNYLYNGLEIDYWDKFGVKNVSTIYFGFTKWLYDLTKDLDNLFFIARDGYIIEKIYNLFNVDGHVKTNYLYCSRKSMLVPSLYSLATVDMVTLLSNMYVPDVTSTLKDFLVRCEVNLEDLNLDILHLFEFQSFDDELTVDNFYCAKKMLVFLNSNIKKNLKKKYDLALEYLQQEGCCDYSLVNVMDIGWAGSIQSSIQRLLSKAVHGYYFGTINTKQYDDFTTKFGYYFDLSYKEEDKDKILDNVMMYELIFSAPHGSTVGYEKKGNKIVPILDCNKDYNDIVASFQQSAIDIIKKYLDYIEYFDYVSKDFCTVFYQEFIHERKYKDIKMFSKLSNDFALGNSTRYNYVNVVSENDINDNKKFLEVAKRSLWPFSFIMNAEDFNEQKYLSYKSNLFTYMYNLSPLSYVKIYMDYGNGFNEIDTVFLPFQKNNDSYFFEYNFDKTIYNIRIDPIEGRKIILNNLIVTSNVGAVDVVIPHQNYVMNKLKKGIYIYSKDPRIIVNHTENYKYISFFANIKII